MNTQQTLATTLDLPSYLMGAIMLIVVMVFHGLILLQIAKRYEVKIFLLLSEHKYAEVSIYFYLSVLLLFLTHIAEIMIWGFSLYFLNLFF